MYSLNASLSKASLLVERFAAEGVAPVLSNPSLSKESLLVERFDVDGVAVASKASQTCQTLSCRTLRCRWRRCLANASLAVCGIEGVTVLSGIFLLKVTLSRRLCTGCQIERIAVERIAVR